MMATECFPAGNGGQVSYSVQKPRKVKVRSNVPRELSRRVGDRIGLSDKLEDKRPMRSTKLWKDEGRAEKSRR
jgi:hypothetical protein